MQRSIVVTGLGLVTSIGIGREAFWHDLLMGRSGIGPVQAFDTSAYRGGTQGAEVKAFRAADYLVRLDPAGMGRASQFATAAARLAIADAQLDVSTLDPERAGVSMGTTSGEPHEIERFDDHVVAATLDRIGPEFIASYPCHVIPACVAGEVGFAGVNMTIPYCLCRWQLRHCLRL